MHASSKTKADKQNNNIAALPSLTQHGSAQEKTSHHPTESQEQKFRRLLRNNQAFKAAYLPNPFFTGWNAFATRFVAAPIYNWKSLPVHAYRIQLATPNRLVFARVTQSNSFSLAPLWKRLPYGPLDLLITALDHRGQPRLGPMWKRFYKVPGFDGHHQKPLDWLQAVRSAMRYLLAPARDEIKPYEKETPRGLWSCREDSFSGWRTERAYPAIHHPCFIRAFLLFAESFPDDPLAVEARRQAALYGEWLLKHRQSRRAVCSLFPFSTIGKGRYEGGCEKKNITLFRAARVGEAMVLLYRAFGKERYMEYARHLADVLVRLQRRDGSLPYRVNPLTGKTVEEYTSNVVTPMRLFALLDEIQPDKRYAQARKHAFRWLLKNPIRTRRWQGSYEDGSEQAPYVNLQNWDVNETIRYLIYFRKEIPNAVSFAEELNQFIEDQFVVWQKEDPQIIVRCPTPAVMEQYGYYYPMDAHTGNWLLSLTVLHYATGRKEYLAKAIAAANAIVRGQHAGGAFWTCSGWGYDERFRSPLSADNWPAGSAIAAGALLVWNRYFQSLHKGPICPPDCSLSV